MNPVVTYRGDGDGRVYTLKGLSEDQLAALTSAVVTDYHRGAPDIAQVYFAVFHRAHQVSPPQRRRSRRVWMIDALILVSSAAMIWLVASVLLWLTLGAADCTVSEPPRPAVSCVGPDCTTDLPVRIVHGKDHPS